MTEVDLLTRQTENAYEWTNKLIESVPFSKWDDTPHLVDTNITWQVGHLIMSHYFHSVMVIVGHRKDVLEKIPLRQYDDLFTNGQPIDAKGKVEPAIILGQLNFLQKRSLEILKSMTIERLYTDLEPTHIPHPVAKTKYEALDWNIKHTMYHCGQIGLLKRVIDVRYDFGLRRPAN
jgi:hypothetical protein